jgi:NADPH:quinone reductase-like Zn-dependent oxidoreductase
MKAIVFDRFGEPAEVLHVRDVPLPEPAPGCIRVRMTASPVNPSDLAVVRGRYARRPALPATPGFEGVGVVDAVGRGWLARILGLSPGRRVAVLNDRGGNWQECVVIPARQAVPVPADLPTEQVASYFVNPATALVMTRYVLKVPRGAWLLQTAAASALGRMVIRLGVHYGFRTINVVRRREHAQELRSLGGDAVVCTADESVEKCAAALTGKRGVPFALDAVGGATGLAALRALAPGGRMLAYGVLSGEPLPLDNLALIVGQKAIEGFLLSDWAARQRPLVMLSLLRQIARLLRAGVLATEIGACYPLEQIGEAVRQAETSARRGKILLWINGELLG